MRTRISLVALMTLGVVLSLAPMGYAGGGGLGNPGDVQLFQCYSVAQGARPGHVLSVDDQFTNATQERVGKLQMVCTPAAFSVLNNLGIQAQGNLQFGDHITCYNVEGSRATRSVVQLSDAFGQQTVTVKGESEFICVLADKTCVSGCPVLTAP